ncbi:acetoacetyl-CoA synthetase [Microbacterium saccharophilum]|uniref:Acetoacetyl-CoA synthetase n=1 Tax=Microbacterium saccharophilum TaxID=1213358 RepID=A0A7Z7GEI7_9MICO|nr:acetoacetyl-CoA synthetase [Microbacterium saccharophilum]
MSTVTPDQYVLPPVTWAPTPEQRESSRMHDFLSWLDVHRGLRFSHYRDLWVWSTTEVSEFWDAVREYFEILGEGFSGPALAVDQMPGAVWYPQASLNYAENVLRPASDPLRRDDIAVTQVTEDDRSKTMTWAELADEVGAVAGGLRELGVKPGDRIVAFMPNIPEAIVALLAAASIGAVWSICSPELSVDATLSRFQQLEPVVLFATPGYRFNGRDFDRSAQLDRIEAGLPTLIRTIVVDESAPRASSTTGSRLAYDEFARGGQHCEPLRLPFAHPLWVLFSSGTTGAPKGIVHGHGGMTLEAVKIMGLHQDLGAGDVYHVAANTSWMVWNSLVNALATGASVLCYSGSPTYPRKDRQFELCAAYGVTMLATGAAYLSLLEKEGAVPANEWDLSALRNIMSTASPLPDSTWLWVHEAVARGVHLGSDSGGTDICSGFMGSNPLEPVRLGELQGPQLGVKVQAWSDDGDRLIGEVGEMVVLRPMPSMPLYFWNDEEGERYEEAYFTTFPGVWTHGDWITETPSGGFQVHGRSDATLNRGGIRLGSAELYSALQHVPEILDGLAVGVDRPNGEYYFPLFVVLAPGVSLTEDLKDRVRATIREYASIRHVPDEIIEAPAIPVTHAGKKVEIQVKKLFAGVDRKKAVNPEALANPETIDWFVDRANQFRVKKVGDVE